jgi:cytochrome c peroxidase
MDACESASMQQVKAMGIAAAGLTALFAMVLSRGGQPQAAIPQAPHPHAPAPQSPCLKANGQLDIACTLPGSPNEDSDVKRMNQEIDGTFSKALAQMRAGPPSSQYEQIVLLGRLLLYDKNLSVNHNIACVSCHMPETGFTSAVSLWNQTIVANPGSVPVTNATGLMPNYRISLHKPYPYVYAAFAPILHSNTTNGKLYGGNFWDMRATGTRTTNPAAAQAEDPFVDPNEMAMPDRACVVYRVSESRYANLFRLVWGAQSFNIGWPADVEQVCSSPASSNKIMPTPVRLNSVDRGIANSTYDHVAMSIASNEASTEASPFTSKFDAWLAGKTQMTEQEQRGFDLFNGKARCNHCHLSGFASGQRATSANATDQNPLFTDWGAHNLGVPKNLALPYYYEDKPDQYGWVANPKGLNDVELEVGNFLRGPKNPNPEWKRLAPEYDGRVLTPTLRDVDKRAYPGFVKAYMHNGYLKSLKAVVHFYNTSQSLPRCAQGSPGEGVTCWPPPEVEANLEMEGIGNLGLTDQEEDDVVAFLKTLTDEYYVIRK